MTNERRVQTKICPTLIETPMQNYEAAQVGRPSKYSPEVASQVCGHVASGLSLIDTARRLKLSPSVIYEWLNKYKDFAERYACARELRAETIFEGITALEEKMLAGEIGHQEFKAAVDARKWFLARIAPKYYGDTSKNEASNNIDIATELLKRLALQVESDEQ